MNIIRKNQMIAFIYDAARSYCNECRRVDCIGLLDYQKKAGVAIFDPTGNFEADMHQVMAFYAHILPKLPKNFSVDRRFYVE